MSRYVQFSILLSTVITDYKKSETLPFFNTKKHLLTPEHLLKLQEQKGIRTEKKVLIKEVQKLNFC